MSYRDDVRKITKEGQWTFWHLLIPLLLMCAVIGAISWAVTILARPAQVIERVTEPDRIIQNYEWFENTYNDALAIDRKIETAKQGVASFKLDAGDTRVDRIEYSRLNSILQGLRNQRDDIVSDYNARSNQLTRNLFKGSKLPYQLTISEDSIVEVWE